MLIFHKKRREVVSKALFDIFKLTFVATCVSGFFQGFTKEVKIGIYCTIGLSFLLGFIICPSDKEES